MTESVSRRAKGSWSLDSEPELQTCSKCGCEKHKDEFYITKVPSTGLPIRMRKCKACHATVASAWSKSNPDKVAAARRRRAPVARRRTKQTKYGLNEIEHLALEAVAQGHCSICQRFVGDDLFIDHDHGTGVVRELLCHGCNSGLGFFRDDPEVALRAVVYLIRHKGGQDG